MDSKNQTDSFSNILNETFSFLKANYIKLIILSLPYVVFSFIVGLAAYLLIGTEELAALANLNTTSADVSAEASAELLSALTEFLVNNWIYLLIGGTILVIFHVSIYVLTTTSLMRLVENFKKAHVESLIDSLSFAIKRFLPVFLTHLIQALISLVMAGLLISFAALVVGTTGVTDSSFILGGLSIMLMCVVLPLVIVTSLYLNYKFVFAVQAAAVNDKNPIEAFRSSWKETKGRFWRLLGYTLVISLVTGIVLAPVNFFFSLFSQLIAQTLGQGVITVVIVNSIEVVNTGITFIAQMIPMSFLTIWYLNIISAPTKEIENAV